MKKLLLPFIVIILYTSLVRAQPGKTTVTKWQYDRTGAVSITWDDGSINQFKIALPILNKLQLKSTFFIITGQIPGSQYHGRFIGRPVKDIINETATIPTNKSNFYERASAAGYLGLIGPLDYHYQAGSLIDAGKPEEAYKVMDECYNKVRKDEFKPGIQHNTEYNDAHGTTWAQIKKYAAQGHEFASHMITHPRLAALDETNMLYELEKSRLDVLHHLGTLYTFSAEGPFGTENERVVAYANKIYPALRNRMPEPWLKEISRSNPGTPGNTNKEYVQFQRGATSKTPLSMMKSWVDTTLSRKDTWLVLTHHGVDGIGWEALPHQELDEYFTYIKSHENKLWIATFGDVTRYICERQSAQVHSSQKNDAITVRINHTLNKVMYNLPLTLKTYVPVKWKTVSVTQGSTNKSIKVNTDAGGAYVVYQAYPSGVSIALTGR